MPSASARIPTSSLCTTTFKDPVRTQLRLLNAGYGLGAPVIIRKIVRLPRSTVIQRTMSPVGIRLARHMRR
jgi:hypothetical protein